MPRLEIALLGPPEILIDGSPVKTDRRKAIALLAYLAVTGRSHNRDHLSGLLWPDYNQESAYAYLRRTLWELNQILGKGWIEADRERVSLSANLDIWLDIAEFEALVHAPQAEIEPLVNAARLYRDDFLSGFGVADTAPFEDWQFQQAEYFRRELTETLEKLVQVQTRAENYGLAIPYARRWLALDPLDETAHRAIMGLLAGIGDRTGAIRQYETCRQALKDEFGLDPQPETTALYEAILQGEIPAASRPTSVTPIDQPFLDRAKALRLPALPTPFIGRRPEVEQIKTLVSNPDHRLITLIGPGGTGKTRLSIQAASELGERFPNGVYFVPLATVQTTGDLIPAIANALDFSFYRDEERPRRQLLDFMSEKRLLLILDNFEHLLDGSELVADILVSAPEVKLIVTTRVRLNVQGEQLYPVSGMRIPAAAETLTWDNPEEQAKPFSAVQLFMDRARRVKPDFRLTKQNVQEVLKICHQVQGMPLGLELAAAWLELLPPAEIAAEIARSLDFLETDQIDVPDRQRSLRAVFETSWKLLSQEERDIFLRLCVFVGSFSSEAARQVSGASLRILLSLANKSWLQPIEGGRFQLHELMRQYGFKRLKSETDVWLEAQERHATYFVGFAARQSERMRNSEQLAGIAAFEEEFNTNIRAAWEWLVAEHRWNEISDPIALALFQYGTIRELMEPMIPWLRDARLQLANSTGAEDLLAFAIISTLEVYCEENEGILDANPKERMLAIWHLVIHSYLEEAMGFWFVLLAGLVRARSLDPDVEAQLEKAVTRFRDQNDPWALGVSLLIQANSFDQYYFNVEHLLEASRIFKGLGVLYEQGIIAEMLGRTAIQNKRPIEEIMAYFQEAKQFFKKLGAEIRLAITNFVYLTGLYFREGQIEQGFALHHETQSILEQVGNLRLLATSAWWESLHALRYSSFDHALTCRQLGLEISQKLNVQSDLSWHTYELGDIYRVFGQPEKAIELYEQAYASFERMNLILGKAYYWRARGDIALQKERYPEALQHYRAFHEYAIQDNHRWSILQARAKLALVNAYLKNKIEARAEMRSALDEMQQLGENDLELQALLAEPVCLIQEGKEDQAVKLAALIAYHPVSWNETKQLASAILETAGRGILPEAVQAAIEQGKSLNLDSVVTKLVK